LIIWSRQQGDNHYELRKAGHSIRLYRNAVFHSQYNGTRILNGGVWDILWLPVFFRPAAKLKRILVLGVGAGAAIKKLQRFLPQAYITGVDVDAVHLEIARQFVGLDDSAEQLSLVHADAIQWLADYRGAAFDVIIDDLYSEAAGEPCRIVDYANEKQWWLKQIKQRLSSGGVLMANCISPAQVSALVAGQRNSLTGAFKYGFSLHRRGFDNRIGIVSSAQLQRQALFAHLAQALTLEQTSCQQLFRDAVLRSLA